MNNSLRLAAKRCTGDEAGCKVRSHIRKALSTVLSTLEFTLRALWNLL